MIYRGDVQEGEIISTRRVSPSALATGDFNFSDKVQQQGDIKSFGGSVPPESLAAGRCVVEFTDKPQPSTFPDLTRFRDGTAIVSVAKQLRWDTSGQGFFHDRHGGDEGRRRLRAGPAAATRQRDDRTAKPLGERAPHGARQVFNAGQHQTGLAQRRRPQLQHGLQIFCHRPPHPRQRPKPPSARTSPSHDLDRHPPHRRRPHLKPRRPTHRPNAGRPLRPFHRRRHPRLGSVLRSGISVARARALASYIAACFGSPVDSLPTQVMQKRAD